VSRGKLFLTRRLLIDFGVYTQNHFVKCMEHVLGTGLRDLFLLSVQFFRPQPERSVGE
jgi:hypothetical protein